MVSPRKKAASKKRHSKKKSAKPESSKQLAPRDVPSVPTPQEIEQSIAQGKTLPLSDFVKRVKW